MRNSIRRNWPWRLDADLGRKLFEQAQACLRRFARTRQVAQLFLERQEPLLPLLAFMRRERLLGT